MTSRVEDARWMGSTATAIVLCLALAGCATTSSDAPDRPTLLSVAANPDEAQDAAAVQSSKAGMSLAQVALYTVATNPDIGIARAQQADADANVSLTNSTLGPVVSYSAAVGRERTYAYDTTITTNAYRSEASLSVSQPLFDFGKKFSDIKWARALKESASLRLDAKALDILGDTVDAYLAVLELDLQIGNSQANIAAHQKMQKIVQLNQEGGNGTAADVQKAQTRLDVAKSELLDLQAQRRTAASQFERITGLAPGKLSVPVPPKAGKSAATDASQFEGNDPMLLSLKQDKASLEAQIAALQAGYLPEISLEATARIQENVSGVNPPNASARAMVTMRGTLFDSGEKSAKIKQLEARIMEVDYRYERALDNLTFDLGDASRVLGTAGDRLNNIAARITSGEKVVDLTTQQFESGTKTAFELLDAQQELSGARSEQITARFDVLRARYRQLRVTGELARVLGG